MISYYIQHENGEDQTDGLLQQRCNSSALDMELRLYPILYPMRYRSGPWFNIKMPPYQYREHNCEDKMIVRLSYLNSGVLYTDKTIFLYWIGALSILSQWTVHILSSRVSYGVSLFRVSYGVSLSRVSYGVSLSRVCYGISFVHIFWKNNYVIKRFDIVFFVIKKTIFSRKSIWKCHLRNVSHFVPTLMC